MPIVLSWSCTPALSLKVRAPAVARGTYREVNPYHTTFLFYQQFVVVLMTQVADVQQAGSIPQRLFHTDAAYIYGAPRQVVARRHSTHRLVHLRASEPTVDDDGVVTLTIQVVPSSAQLL